jgi:RNA polymerase sigma factor (sigma-70 family)
MTSYGAAGEARSSSDAELIACSLADPKAFEGVFDRHYATIRRYVARRLSPACADDVAAEAFCIAFDRRQQYIEQRPDCPVAAWLFGIATNLVHGQRRDERRQLRAYARAGAAAGALDEGPELSRRVDAQRAGPAVARALASLSADERDVLLLYALADLDYKGIADALQIPIGTVRSRLARARARAAQHLTGHDADRERLSALLTETEKDSSCTTST